MNITREDWACIEIARFNTEEEANEMIKGMAKRSSLQQAKFIDSLNGCENRRNENQLEELAKEYYPEEFKKYEVRNTKDS